MKKLFTLLVVALLCGVTTYAQNVDNIRIYINPGHGSWGPNNRHMATLGGHETIDSANPDTTDFYESNTNLWKCLELFHRLKSYGFKHDAANALDLSQNLVMSRIENGPYPYETVDDISPDQNNAYNRTLSEVAAEVEANNFDYFISVHSNALTEGATTNYPIYLYRGYDDMHAVEGLTSEIQQTSRAMAAANWPYLYENEHMNWTAKANYNATKANIRGDINFMGSSSKSSLGYTGYYGVLKHGVPGYIVEGYFHTYQPARHRAMNYKVCQIEGLGYAHGIAAYYGVSTESTGNIYGIVRDMDEKFSDALYTPVAGTDDVYKPLNGVEVTLKQGENVVATATTDGNYNGAFVFKDLEPGTYTLEYSHVDYLAPDAEQPTTVEVTASKTAYPKVFLRNVNWTPPTITYVNYPDSTAGKSEYMLLPDYDMSVKVSGTGLAELEGKTIRRTLVRGGNAFFLAVDAENKPTVVIYEIASKSIIKTLGTTAANGDILPISDIALTADHYLVGINKANQAYNGANNVKAYKWENGTDGLPEGEASIWWESNFAGNWSNGISGEACYYDGTLEDGQFVYTGTTIASGGNTRIIFTSISDGKYIGHMRNNQDGVNMSTAVLGETYTMTLSPNADDNFVLNSDKVDVLEYAKNSADVGLPTLLGKLGEDKLALASANESYFKYAGRSLMVAPDVNAEGLVQGIKLFDITDGMANAVEVKLNCTIEPIAYSFASAHGELELSLTTDDQLADADMVLYLNVDGKITKWGERVASAAAPTAGGTANPFAYALSSEVKGEAVNIKFSLNAAASDVNIIVKDAEGNVVETLAQGALAAGEHTATIEKAGYLAGNYTWEVEVAGETKTAVEQFVDRAFFHPGDVVVDNSMESPSFGTLFVAAGYSSTTANGSRNDGVPYVDAEANTSGLYIYDAAGNSILNPAGGKRFFGSNISFDKTLNTSNVGDMARVALTEDGRIFVGRCSDAGDYLLYAESLDKLKESGEFTSLLAGQTMTSYAYNDANGNFMVGPIQALAAMGSGENAKLAVICRVSNDNAGYVFSNNRTLEYALGNATALPTPTAVPVLDKKYTIGFNKTVNIDYDNEGGIWYCQYRGTSTEDQPGLVYVDAAGKQQYKDFSVHNRRSGAMALSPDSKYLAAMSGAGQTTVYRIFKSAEGAVALRAEYIITTGGNNMYGLAWDAAGNLYGANASTEYVRGYAIPRTEPFVTKAASKYAFVVEDTQGLEDIEIENAEEPVYFYNLQGIQVDADNLIPGIYIKVQGKTSTKVLVK